MLNDIILPMESAIYKTVILKISGEAIGNPNSSSILDKNKLLNIANLIKNLTENGIRIGVVCGAGNIFRGRIASEAGVDPIDGDYMGMVGTVINCKAISSVLNKVGVKNILFGALEVEDVAVKYSPEKARISLDNGFVCLFSGGTGKPTVTTDSCAAKRALEIGADAILAGKNGVTGVFDKDPNKFSDAKFLKNLTYKEALEKNIEVMDELAMRVLENSDVVVRVFSMEDIDNFRKVIFGEKIGSTISK